MSGILALAAIVVQSGHLIGVWLLVRLTRFTNG